VSRLDEGGDARHVLLCDPATTRLTPLIERTLLEPGAASAAFRSAAGLERLTLADAIRT
jgi:membrane protein